MKPFNKSKTGVDPRNGWRTHVVTVGGDAVGFTDGVFEDTTPNPLGIMIHKGNENEHI